MRLLHGSSIISGIAVVAFAQSQTEYDYVVCGGGTAGLAVANRLSENADVTVLIVEGGVDGTMDRWVYRSLPQVYANNRVVDSPAGKTVGGTTRINGKVYSRPDRNEIDDWGTVNNADWSWDTLLPFYKKSESLRIPRDDIQVAGNTYNEDFHGFSGPVNVSYPEIGVPDFFAVLEDTFANLSIPRNRDFNGGNARGLSTFPSHVVIKGEREQVRESAKESYYLPAAGRPNLELIDETQCLRLVWGNSSGYSNTKTARGVEIANANNQTVITARKEVILSAGVYRSSGILEYSGVGNPDILTPYGIKTVINLPGVGENLQDQMTGSIGYFKSNESNITFPSPVGDETTVNYIVHLNYEDIFGDDAGEVQERVNASLSSYADTVSQRINGSLSAAQVLNSLQVQYNSIFNTLAPTAELLIIGNLNGGTINMEFWPLVSLSRGSVHISGGDPQATAATPFLDENWGMLQYDWDIYTATARYVRRLFQIEPLASEVADEKKPGLEALPTDASDEEYRSYWADKFRAGWHAVGSAAMLPREWGGVVDGDLRVYGTSNVRVVDASVIPFMLGGHPVSTLYALAERAAELIKSRIR